MKTLSFCSIALFILTVGCDNVPAQNNDYGNHQVSQAIPVQSQSQNITNASEQRKNPNEVAQDLTTGGNNITMHAVINSKTGQASMHIPFPESWTFIEGAGAGQPAMRGPNGLLITIYRPQTFFYTNMAGMQQVYQGNKQMIAPVGINNVMRQQIMQEGQQMGMTMQNQYELNEVAAKDAEYANRLNGGSPGQNNFQAIGSDWTDRDGKKVLVVLHYYEINSPNMVNWGYSVDLLKVNADHFAQAKKNYIFGISHKAYNQNEINAFNAQLAARQNADNARFQATQKKFKEEVEKRRANTAETTEKIRNINEASYQYRQHNRDVVHELEDNFLNDIDVVVSPIDGKEYQVESGSKSYWINDEGKYIMSDDPLYDPNKYETHPDVWQKAPRKEYK